MILYLGGIDMAVQALEKTGLWEDFRRKDFLGTFHNKQQARFIENRAHEMNHTFLDCGAFSFMNSVFKDQMTTYYKDPQHEEYYKKYCSWIDEHGDKVDTYAVLDIIGNEEETLKMTNRMEEEGYTPLPIFHLTSPTWKYLDYYIEKYDYIAIGGAVKAGGDMTSRKREVLFKKIYERIRTLKPDLKIHALGITTLSFLKQYEVYSCDSVSWAMCAAMGGAMFFDNNTGNAVQLEFTDRKENPRAQNNLTKKEWAIVEENLEKMKLTVDQVRLDIPSRRAVNLVYYQDMAEYLTEYYETVREKRRHKTMLF